MKKLYKSIDLLKKIETLICDSMNKDDDGKFNDPDLIFFYRAAYILRDEIETYIKKVLNEKNQL